MPSFDLSSFDLTPDTPEAQKVWGILSTFCVIAVTIYVVDLWRRTVRDDLREPWGPRQTSIYVAGKYDTKDVIHERIRDLRDRGYRVPHDWTVVEQSNREPEHLARYAKFDSDGVEAADGLLVFMEDPDYHYRGTWFECATALALRKPVIIVGVLPKGCVVTTNVFYHHPALIHVPSYDDALVKLEELFSQ